MQMTDKNISPCKFLLVGFDGLRPCDITPDVMPNLARFRDENHTWENYLASFPTETYVNHPVIFSGFRPNGHGLIANSFFCPDLKGKAQLFCGWDTGRTPRRLWLTGAYPSSGPPLVKACG